MKPNLYGFGQASFGELNAGISGNKFYYLNYLDNFQEIFAYDDRRVGAPFFTFFGLTKKGKLIEFSTYSSPVQIGNFNWKKIYASSFYERYGIREDGKLFKLYRGSSPVQIGNERWIETSLNRSIRYDGLMFEGANRTTQVGDFTWSKVSDIGAIRSDGLLFTWGDNNFGQLGDNTIVSKTSPVQIGNFTWSKIDNIFDGSFSACIGIRSDGFLFAWGINNGKLGLNDVAARSSPVQVGNSVWVDVRCSSWSCFAIDSNYNLFSLGGSNYNANNFRIGLPQYDTYNGGSEVSSPIQIGTRKIKKVFSSSLFLDQNDRGVARSEVLFLTEEISKYTNLQKIVKLSNKPYKKIFFNGSCAALDYNDNLWVWGNGYGGSLGNNSSIVANTSPVLLNSLKYKEVSFNERITFAIRSDGLLFGWGDTSLGALGDNTSSAVQYSSPIQIGNQKWKKLTVFSDLAPSASAAIREDGLLFAWGANAFGFVGDGTGIFRSSPVQIGSQSWSMIASHGYTTHAIRSDGLLFGWGQNTGTAIVNGRRVTIGGAVGDNSTVSRSSPVQIGNQSWITVCGSSLYTLAIRSDGLLFNWGLIYTPTSSLNYSSPVQIGNKKWKFVSSYNYTNLAIDEDDNLYSWGRSFNNEIIPEPTKLGEKKWKEAYTGSTNAYFKTIIGLTKE